MKVAVVHYHARPGGVTRVVERAVDALGDRTHCLFFTGEAVTCISSFSNVRETRILDKRTPGLDDAKPCVDLFGGNCYNGAGKLISLNPYQTVWLTT
jgi:hypothetical protein